MRVAAIRGMCQLSTISTGKSKVKFRPSEKHDAMSRHRRSCFRVGWGHVAIASTLSSLIINLHQSPESHSQTGLVADSKAMPSTREHNDGYSTRSIHVGSEPDPVTGALAPNLTVSTTFKFRGLDETTVIPLCFITAIQPSR